ncbi:hypothetical protein [Flavisolibacter ginsenosidimutans]|uniref:Uncharacterized protein n=1 Tax=Flavisolibacter ginsenosidimutans TaxID=661481 RepID=A0A5B8ULD4_9BACT|nr:hypothetical protein [Flavisolibacter ginsenosidimutans]QEC56860.1 hypothetical protein FSB75_13465 [Flavisolibacter ginsenosidimutans]
MRRNSTPAIGALHPVLFMLLVYIISIVLAFFVCRTIYFSLHPDEGTASLKVEKTERLMAVK